MEQSEQITIDGPAASGKSTVAKCVARELRWLYINSGNMYRAVTWFVQQHDVLIEEDNIIYLCEQHKLDMIRVSRDGVGYEVIPCLREKPIDEKVLRSSKVVSLVSFLATLPGVRYWVTEKLKATASFGKLVVDGRDIGTVVFPHARYKFFLTASPQERARRRLLQEGNAQGSSLQEIEKSVLQRDKVDSERKISPLRPASDAITIDTTYRSIHRVVETIIKTVSAPENNL